MAECGDWSDPELHAVTPGGVYELEYGEAGSLGGFGQSPERDPLFFVLSSHPDAYTLEALRNVGILGFGPPVARVIARGAGPARELFPATLQVPAAASTRDLALRLTRIRYCGTATTSERERAHAETRDRRARIESDDELNPVAATLENVRGLATGAGVLAAAVLLVLAWPLLERLLEGLTKAGTLSWE